MLNIPSEVKALFKQDGVRKNFRVKFPNGEYNDITNTDVVKESVRFTESACSQDVFRFGLAEASVLEFESVGVGNMYGMTISAFYEIDTSSLTVAQISAIQTDPGDGTLVLEGDSDIGWGFYRIPLGMFIVDSCPRNHGAMTHRRVTAYTPSPWRLNPLEAHKLEDSTLLSKYTFRVKDYVYSNLGYYYPDLIADGGYTKASFGNWSAWHDINVPTPTAGTAISDGTQTLVFRFPHRRKTMAFSDDRSIEGNPIDALFGVEMQEYVPTEAAEAVAQILADKDFDLSYYDGTEYQSDNYFDFVCKRFSSQLLPTYHTMGVRYNGQPNAKTKGLNVIFGDVPIFSPHRLNTNFTYDAVSLKIQCGNIDIPYNVQIQYKNQSDSEFTDGGTFMTGYTNWPVAYRYTDESGDTDIQSVLMTFGATSKGKTQVTGDNSLWYKFDPNPIDFQNILKGYLEIRAMFGRQGRLGASFQRLSQSAVATLQRADYEELWWDDYPIAPVGSVNYTYQDGDVLGEDAYKINGSESVYDMTDNYVFKRMKSGSKATVESLISQCFAPYAESCGFLPFEATTIGLPYLESGDYIAMVAETGEQIESTILRRTLAGIQRLTDSLEAVGGRLAEG